ncbi:MAG TPA: class I SAM-dependent methyltransferase [Phycisphaerales bacterium]|nr:class I SAM-dependent methyltransferase [Phycisphaerales bacterium]
MSSNDLDARRERERAKYLALASAPGSTYGSTNHGRHAVPLIARLKPPPRLVVDFGCGRNDFIRQLRRLGVEGLGVDFAFSEADVLAPLHATGLQNGVADVVTSFDALEHLLPEDVDPALAEMRCVARPGALFVISVATRPSRIKVDGEGLHPTVRPLAWWLDRLGRVGTVTRGGGAAREGGAEERYIVGRFKGSCCA